jgi:hypothetical protein
MDPIRAFGISPTGGSHSPEAKWLRRTLHLKLLALGHGDAKPEFGEGSLDLITNHRERCRLLHDRLSPIDARIQAFLDRTLGACSPKLPSDTLMVDRHGLAREASLPEGADEHHSPILSSYRLANGVLHNPLNDRRTTQGSFHVATGGLAVPFDKYAVPLGTFAKLLAAALKPPADHLVLPFTATWERPARVFASLMLRPLVRPEIPGVSAEQRMEIRFFVPGSLVANLDFVESIFGNAGDPYLPENDAGLDTDHWSGHTGCVILAPHLTTLSKQELGLPHWDQADERQRREGMCWKDPKERYNGGSAFKLTNRTADGVMVTLIADNYFGYCKKEVKTQIGFAANLGGLAEEEHAGGALAFPSFNLGDTWVPDRSIGASKRTLAETLALLGDRAVPQAEGHAVLRDDPRTVLVPHDVKIELHAQTVSWNEGRTAIPLRLGHTYIHPTGYQVHAQKHPGAPSWRLIGTSPAGTFCHKPCTVSGGGKSEISKRLADAVLYGPIVVTDVERDMALVQKILDGALFDYSKRLKPQFTPDYSKRASRAVLAPERSLGSVIKMFTPNDEFTDEYNAWLESIPHHIWPLVFIVKRFYNPAWGTDWRKNFILDQINGRPGFQLKLKTRPLVGSYLRVGLDQDGSWKTFKLRQDFMPAEKIQMEDDITASVVVPGAWVGLDPAKSYKLAQNCEARLFQRPDDAVHRGYDKQTEKDMAAGSLFCSNYLPMKTTEIQAEIEDFVRFDKYTAPMADHLSAAAARGDTYTISSAVPRLIDGKPSKNPRYLQLRPDFGDPRPRKAAELALRIHRRIPADKDLVIPVDGVLCGRRNNPPEPGVRALCVFNPLHYQELPELFMDFVSSLTGKSPSTTGAGSEGALTKGPFNAVRATADLNNALIGMILTGHDGFSSAAGYVGPKGRMDHDISLLVPEVWCRLRPEERSAAAMAKAGHLEPVKDFEFQGRTVLASRLGWRITQKFLHDYFGRIFDNGTAVFDNALLRPETQDLAVFADGVDNIVEAQTNVAKSYLADGTVEDACPPLKALLHIMATGSWNGKGINDPAVRAMFTRQHLLASDWYKVRLACQQSLDIATWTRHVANLESFLADDHGEVAQRLGLADRLARAKAMLDRVSAPAWRERLVGTIGADPAVRRS